MEVERVRVVVLDDYHSRFVGTAPMEGLKALPEVDEVRVLTEPCTEDELIQRIADCDAVIAIRERTRFTDSLLGRLPQLKVIAQTGNHVYHVDMEAASRHGVAVMLDPGPSGGTAGTAELAIALMLAASRRLPYYNGLLHDGGWEAPFGSVLWGKTLGVVGLGKVGGHVARIADAMGMRLLAWSRHLTDAHAAEYHAERRSLEDLLAESDVVSVHLTLSEESRGLLNRERLALMKPSALLINTARGAIIDEAALVEALQAGRLGGAGLDVFSEEPLPPDHPLRALPNVVLMPHAGWPVDTAYENFSEQTAGMIRDFLSGRYAKVLNPEALARQR